MKPLLLVLCLVLAGCATTEPSTKGASDSSTPGATARATAKKAKKAAPKPKVIDHATASGDFAIAQAAGNIDNPGDLKVKVTSKPAQKVDVTWALVCAQGLGAGSKDGQFKATTPVTRALKKPSKDADSCTVSANAQLSTGGRVTVTLLG